MKKIILDSCINIIKDNKDFDDTKLAEIRYGLEGLYLTITKLIIIGLLACILNIFKELVIFLIAYNFPRMTSYGLHATKSWICLLTSIIIFIGVPLICKNILLQDTHIILIGIIMIILFYKNSPADTEKRPIVDSKRRLTLKLASVCVCIAMITASLLIDDTFISNSLIFALIVQSFMISPTVYKMFNLKYDNYKTYLNNN